MWMAVVDCAFPPEGGRSALYDSAKEWCGEGPLLGCRRVDGFLGRRYALTVDVHYL